MTTNTTATTTATTTSYHLTPPPSTLGHAERRTNESNTTTSNNNNSNNNSNGTLSQRSPPSPRAQSKSILTIALQKAQSAVEFDAENDFAAALEAYRETVGLLSQVVDKSANEVDRRRLQLIHDTYVDRIRLLSTISTDSTNTSTDNINTIDSEQTSTEKQDDDDNKQNESSTDLISDSSSSKTSSSTTSTSTIDSVSSSSITTSNSQHIKKKSKELTRSDKQESEILIKNIKGDNSNNNSNNNNNNNNVTKQKRFDGKLSAPPGLARVFIPPPPPNAAPPTISTNHRTTMSTTTLHLPQSSAPIISSSPSLFPEQTFPGRRSTSPNITLPPPPLKTSSPSSPSSSKVKSTSPTSSTTESTTGSFSTNFVSDDDDDKASVRSAPSNVSTATAITTTNISHSPPFFAENAHNANKTASVKGRRPAPLASIQSNNYNSYNSRTPTFRSISTPNALLTHNNSNSYDDDKSNDSDGYSSSTTMTAVNTPVTTANVINYINNSSGSNSSNSNKNNNNMNAHPRRSASNPGNIPRKNGSLRFFNNYSQSLPSQSFTQYLSQIPGTPTTPWMNNNYNSLPSPLDSPKFSSTPTGVFKDDKNIDLGYASCLLNPLNSPLFHQEDAFSNTLECILPEQPPNDSHLKPFWLMRLLERTMTTGGYLTPKLYVPKYLWLQGHTKLNALETKISSCEVVLNCLLRLAKSPANDMDTLVKELESIDLVLEGLQNSLARKVSCIESTTGKSKQSTSSLMSWGSKLSRGLDRMGMSNAMVRNEEANGYIDVLLKLFQNVGIVEKHLCHFSSLKAPYHHHHTQIVIRLFRFSDFFGNVICRFVIKDLNILTDKYMKKGSHWLID